jgi:phytoene dehydrogenase-like protein
VSKETIMADYDAIVIGSGIGGLAAATRLSQNDRAVLLLEAAEEPGGYIRPVVNGEYTFDLGIHYLGKLGPGEIFRELLDSLGLEDVEFIELDPEGFDRYVFPDYEFNFCKGKEQLADRLIRDFPSEEKGIQKFLDITVQCDEAYEPHKMVKGSLLSWVPHLLRNPVLLKYGRSTYQAVLDRITRDKRLQAVLSAPLFDVALGPRKASAVAGFYVWSYFLEGAYYPRGGSRALRDAFVQGLLRRGVELMNSNRVTDLLRKDNRWVVRTETGDEYRSSAVISDVDPKTALCSLVDRDMVPRRAFKKADRLKPSGSILSTFIGTDLNLSSYIGSGNITRYDDWDLDAVYETWVGKTVPRAEQGMFLNSPSVRDPEGGFAPEGQHTLQIFTGGSFESLESWVKVQPEQRGEDYRELKDRIMRDMIEAAEIFVPRLSEHITFSECITPLECMDRVGAIGGGIYGPEQTPNQMGPGRYHSLESGIEGLFFAGAGTFGGGLLLCAASGALAADKVVKYLDR